MASESAIHYRKNGARQPDLRVLRWCMIGNMIIKTERLILRPIDPDLDFEPWARAMADENTVRYLGTKPMSQAESWRSMAMAVGHWAIRGYGFFSLEHRETGAWVGRVGPWFPLGWPAPEVGWTIAWPQVIHVIMEGNEASIAVAKKLGSTLIRTQQGVPGITEKTVLIYGQSAMGGPAILPQ